MKNLTRISPVLILLCALCTPCLSQEFYRGEMFVTAQRFSLDDGRLNVELSVDFEGLKMPSDESLTVTPVLRTDVQKQELPSVLINGPEKEKVFRRSQALSGGSHASPIPAVVIRNDAGISRSFKYSVTIPYEPWMEQAVLLLRSQECACHGKAGDVYEDRIADRIRLPKSRLSPMETGTDVRYLALVNFIEPAPDRDSLHAITGSIPFYEAEIDRKGGKQLGDLAETKRNTEIYYRLRDVLRDIRRDASTELVKIKLTGYGAPTGNVKKNEVEAAQQSLHLKEYLRENRLTHGAPLEVSWVPEDWDSIASLVKQSDMLFRDATLDLINNVDVSKGRERMLLALADGNPYKYLVDKVFPSVMRVEYTVDYTRQPLDAAESLRMFRMGGGRALTLNEFFAMAGLYPAGSTEYNDVLDLAARLFPDSPEANINAAAVALTKKDTRRARKYLERFATLPMAYNNMGILCLLEGNRDKAEVYLTMAAAAGVEQAKKALKSIRF